ncbi:Dps family protein [Simkania negevensis]|uniref:Uncharacterized protein slr1894 n=1 Tax=Simkania negevensis (strain ATCC VR-1471 / DSM 27360 / Z) TaxID=331113 RepID=F8L8X8_SIMNZ|nr:DNA starvation/stationary phase protection protein [Simkania negevensis]MCB1074867.1 DNA starvation/stationary phase protection protein [Simkania sp.]CCB89279.1 uncharacterized protein slr1894 [Simkania negevensis Z]
MNRDIVELHIGLQSKERGDLCEILQRLLASSYALYLKTQNFHWNVTGPAFHSYHLLFQDQYEELAEAIDEIAERIRMLGEYPEGSFESFTKISLIKCAKEVLPPLQMMETLLHDHETVIRYLRDKLPYAEKVEDGATADFINKRLAVHEKTAWMLRSSLTQF